MALPEVVKNHIKQETDHLNIYLLDRNFQSARKMRSFNREDIIFISRIFELSVKEITDAYRRRWDIEVFFRFIKQELNVSHLISLNTNGIEVMLYMTLIAAMLI
ncbi:MAG: transposase [Dysgonamonadaceae bacterium]|jgi:IS4 transposase|nr:transposase [Dysgonamonadaceae bacterium]